jgi:hypothetical protein
VCSKPQLFGTEELFFFSFITGYEKVYVVILQPVLALDITADGSSFSIVSVTELLQLHISSHIFLNNGMDNMDNTDNMLVGVAPRRVCDVSQPEPADT